MPASKTEIRKAKAFLAKQTAKAKPAIRAGDTAKRSELHAISEMFEKYGLARKRYGMLTNGLRRRAAHLSRALAS